MTLALNFLVESAVRQAEAQGAFENLPGAGQPLEDLHQPKDAVIDRLMKEAGAKPAGVTLQVMIAESRERLRVLPDGEVRRAEMRRLADLQTRFAIEQESRAKYG